MRVLLTIVVLVLLAVVSLILIFDPPPLRLKDPSEFVLSVPPPPPDGIRHQIEQGLGCNRKLQSYTSGYFGRPQITLFDWLKHQQGKAPQEDYHLVGRKPNDTWAVKVDRATNLFCYQKPSDVEAGLTDPYCGPKIIHENATRIVAVEDNDYSVVRVVFFDKKKYTLTMTEVSEMDRGGAGIEYLECH